MKQTAKAQHTDKNTAISYAGYRFPPELISYAVWLYFRFALSLRMVEEMLAARGIEVTVRNGAPLGTEVCSEGRQTHSGKKVDLWRQMASG